MHVELYLSPSAVLGLKEPRSSPSRTPTAGRRARPTEDGADRSARLMIGSAGWSGNVTESRKLAAILAADIVGYSRLAGADEERVLARLRTLRSDLVDPTIAVHGGRVVKRTGDGVLVEFRSVVDAVRCAIDIQLGMAERNVGLPPEKRMEYRVGVHIGDVVEERDGDLMGDGVNIAARLEGIAEPGRICLSEQAYWQVKGRLDLGVKDLGPTRLKNIAEPVHVYSLEAGVPARARPAAKVGYSWSVELTSRRRDMTQFSGSAQAALDYNSTIIGALELSEKKWVLAVQLPGVSRYSRHVLEACGDGLASFLAACRT